MRVDFAIVGGTGIGELISSMSGIKMFIPTRSGMVKAKVIKTEDANVLCVQRHSSGHSVPPHRVNYLALADSFRQLGVKACIATAAVGSLKREWKPGTLVLCKDFIDLSGRNYTSADEVVHHTDLSVPFSDSLAFVITGAAEEKGVSVEQGGIYANLNGPRYETPQEIEMVRLLGANLVGMTAASEAVACKEAGIAYACIAVVTNAAASWEGAQLDHRDVVSVMRHRGPALLDLILYVARAQATQ